MNLLLDTHVALWAVTGHKRLPARARDLISDPDNTVAVSTASLWEIAIKHALGRKSEAVSSFPREKPRRHSHWRTAACSR